MQWLSHCSLLEDKRKEIGDKVTKLRNGLEKIDDTRTKVQAMTVELEVTRVKVAEFQKQCEEYLVVIVQQKQVKCASLTHTQPHKLVPLPPITRHPISSPSSTRCCRMLTSKPRLSLLGVRKLPWRRPGARTWQMQPSMTSMRPCQPSRKP